MCELPAEFARIPWTGRAEPEEFARSGTANVWSGYPRGGVRWGTGKHQVWNGRGV